MLLMSFCYMSFLFYWSSRHSIFIICGLDVRNHIAFACNPPAADKIILLNLNQHGLSHRNTIGQMWLNNCLLFTNPVMQNKRQHKRLIGTYSLANYAFIDRFSDKLSPPANDFSIKLRPRYFHIKTCFLKGRPQKGHLVAQSLILSRDLCGQI